jgi:hypothetical protein
MELVRFFETLGMNDVATVGGKNGAKGKLFRLKNHF